MNELISFVLPSPMPGHGGWGNGYVAVPKGHPLYGKSYSLVNGIDVHGGLTYSEPYNMKRDPSSTADMWIFGFDTLHAYDSLIKWPDENSVLKEANHLKKQIEKGEYTIGPELSQD